MFFELNGLMYTFEIITDGRYSIIHIVSKNNQCGDVDYATTLSGKKVKNIKNAIDNNRIVLEYADELFFGITCTYEYETNGALKKSTFNVIATRDEQEQLIKTQKVYNSLIQQNFALHTENIALKERVASYEN